MPLAIRLADIVVREIEAEKLSVGLRRMWHGCLVEESGIRIHSTYLTEKGKLLDITLEVRGMSW
jgi:hypothetical protein